MNTFFNFPPRTAVGLLLAIVLLASCVPNRKLVYLQQDDLKNREEIPRDSVLRTHPMVISEYRIQPLDILNVQFQTLTEDTDEFNFLKKLSPDNGMGGAMQMGLMALAGIFVDTDGNIEYPVLGKVRVAGLTIFQAEDELRRRASRFVPDVVVRVRMLNFRFTVLGEVHREQVVVASNPRLTIMEAIGMAGGFSELADRSLVKVIRQKGNQSEVHYIDLLTEPFIESPFYFVQQNDLIIVPPLRQRPFRAYFTQNLAILSTVISFSVLLVALLTR